MATTPPPIYISEKDAAEKDSASVEKATSPHEHDYVVQADDQYHLDAHDLDRVQRKLKQRHVQMIAVSVLSPWSRARKEHSILMALLSLSLRSRWQVQSVQVSSSGQVQPSAAQDQQAHSSRTSSSAP